MKTTANRYRGTYFEATGEGEFALHASMEEMTFILDLVNSVSHPVADVLRGAIEAELRGHDRFGLDIKRDIQLCRECGGTEHVRDANVQTNDYDIVPCTDCGMTGRVVKVTTVRYEKFKKDRDIFSGGVGFS